MSYCRNYDKNHEVYLYHHVDGYIECCGCSLGARRCNLGHLHKNVVGNLLGGRFPFFVHLKTRTEAIAHMRKHKRAGHQFPARVIPQLMKEVAEFGDVVESGVGRDPLKELKLSFRSQHGRRSR